MNNTCLQRLNLENVYVATKHLEVKLNNKIIKSMKVISFIIFKQLHDF